MICELKSIDDQIAELEEQRKQQIVLCLTGQRETYQTLLDELNLDMQAEGFNDLPAAGYIQQQVMHLEGLIDLLNQRINLVNA